MFVLFVAYVCQDGTEFGTKKFVADTLSAAENLAKKWLYERVKVLLNDSAENISRVFAEDTFRDLNVYINYNGGRGDIEVQYDIYEH